jgi:superfamily II DNA or RNA helicase
MTVKDTEQRKACILLERSKFRGAIIAGTGYGKTRVGAKCILRILSLDDKPALVLVPFDHLKQRFEDEFNALGSFPKDRIQMECYASIKKLNPLDYSIIVCDEIHLGLTDQCMKFYNAGPESRIVTLTATLPDDSEYRNRLLSLVPVVYSITLDECVTMGLIAPYKIQCISVPLSSKEQIDYKQVNLNFGYWKGKLGFSPFDFAQTIISNSSRYSKEEMNAALGFFRAIRQRKNLVDHAENKIVVCKELSKNPTKKLIFGGDNAFTDKIAAAIPNSRTYHSKIKSKLREAAIDDFRTSRTDTLCSTKALNQGLDIPDAGLGIVCGLTSKALTMIQRTGRLVRIDPKDPTKSGLVIVIYVRDSQEEKWLRNALIGIDPTNVSWEKAEDYGYQLN